MILNWKNQKEFALANGIEEENEYGDAVFRGDSICRGITFRHFHRLRLENALFINCVFEDCHAVAPDDCRMVDCTFRNVDAVEGVYTDFTACTFNDCCSQGPLLNIDSRGKVTGCTFDSIYAMGEDGYIVSAVYGKKSEIQTISHCLFTDCQVENEDGELCSCAYFKPMSYLRTIRVDNVDYETCEGLL